MARRRRAYNPDEPQIEGREGEEVTEQEVEETPPLTEKQIKQNELDAYYAKVLGDLAREHQEADAVHDAAEKRMEAIDAQKVQIDAEYAERTAAIDAEYPEAPPEGGVLASKPPTRWGVQPTPKPQPEPTPRPKPQPEPYAVTS